MDTPTFELRHTKEYIKTLTYAEFMQYKSNCHTVVEVHITGNSDAQFQYIFNPRIIRKFVCLRKLYLTNVRFLHSIFTIPQRIIHVEIYSCTKLKSVIPSKSVETLSIYNCNDLLAVGPFISNNCCVKISNCDNLQNLPRACFDEFNPDQDQIEFVLSATPQIRIDTMPASVSRLNINGNITVLPTRFPTAINSICIPSELFNKTYSIMPVSKKYDICYGIMYSALSQEALYSLIDNAIKHNTFITQFSLINNNSAAFIIKQLLGDLYWTYIVYKEPDMDQVFKILMDICPKYITPVRSIKFNPELSLYESIILSALPKFYKCLTLCKKLHPVKFSIFCNKMRDVMRLGSL